VEDFISAFENLAFRMDGMFDDFFRELFIHDLKDEIRAHVPMECPHTWLEATQRDKESQQIVSTHTHKPSFPPHSKPTNFSPLGTPLKIHKLTMVEMDERQLKGLCYNCDEKYFPRHKCKEQNIFMAVTEDLFEEYVVVPLVEELPLPFDLTLPSNPPEVNLVISLNSLTRFSAPQTLKLIGYIKNQKVIILVDSGITHNFIHFRIAQEFNSYICTVNNFKS
jgi:hypothetical protein